LDDPQRERLAQRVYNRVNTLTSDPTKRFSQANARKLVDQYGPQLVKEGLKRITRDSRIVKPAGWLVTFLRSESKFGAGV
jgi:hypothetical protein